MNEIFELDNVSLKKDSETLLKNISWSVSKNENWVMFGPNGSGKTLLLQIIEGYLNPTSGNITRYGLKFGEYDVREFRKTTGYISGFVRDRIYPNENVAELVISGKFASIGIYDNYTKSEKDRAIDILDSMGISELSGRKFASLSEGEKALVLIARALYNSPELLILDEPCNGLDIKNREMFLQSMYGIKKDFSVAIIFVTHHPEEVILLFDNIVFLKNGCMVKQGKTERLMNSQTISEIFDLEINIARNNDRYYISF